MAISKLTADSIKEPGPDNTLMGKINSLIDGLGAGSGTANTVPKFTAADVMGNSQISDDGTKVGIGTTSPTHGVEIHQSTAGQTTSALTDAGSRAGLLAVNDSGNSAGSGGGVTFGAAATHDNNKVGFAAIKGLLTDGASGTTGDLVISTRNATGDSALTERLRVTAGGAMQVAGALHTVTEVTPAQITADQDNYNPTGLATTSILHVSSDAARSITGLQAPTGGGGRHLWLFNTGSFNITLEYEHANSTATNRFTGNGFADVVIASGRIAHLIYSAQHARWMVVGLL